MNVRAARRCSDLPQSFNAAADLLGVNLDAGRAHKTAFIDHQGTTSFSALKLHADRMAGLLAGLGIKRADRILLCLLDTVDFPIAFLGAIKAGVIPVPLNTLLTTEDYRWILADSGAAAVFVSAECAEAWAAIAAAHPDIRFVSVGGGPWPDFAALLAAAPATPQAAATQRDDTAFWLYTSGSTGRPKGAMHAHGSLRLTANLFGLGVLGYRAEDVVLSVAKQFFAYGLGNALTFPLAAGATTVLHKDRATPQAITDLIKAHGVSVLGGVPTFFAAWFASGAAPTRAQAPRLRIATSAGECLPAHLGEAFRARFGADIIDGLGSTEMLHVYLSQQPGQVRYGCTGRPVPGYRLRIVDEHGRIAAVGQAGELQVQGPTAALGYWANPAKSAETFFGDWTRTGDTYVCDKAGWYTNRGRHDDMLKVGGIYVSPGEVEEALCAHDMVSEAAVVGVADDDDLIKPRAYVVLREGTPANAETEFLLQAFVKSRLAPYKYPRRIMFLDALPKTATGKIQRFRLRHPV